MRKLNKIIIHSSASQWGTPEVIDKWHRERGFDQIGYHYVITNSYPKSTNLKNYLPVPEQDGKLHVGRPLEIMGAHCSGQNRGSVGVCLIGSRQFTSAQLNTLAKLILTLKIKYNDDLEIAGHYEFNPNKTCPNINMDWFRDWFASLGNRVKKHSS